MKSNNSLVVEPESSTQMTDLFNYSSSSGKGASVAMPETKENYITAVVDMQQKIAKKSSDPSIVPDLNKAIKRQVEYYFTKKNLTKDRYLLLQMDQEMYVPVSVICKFRMVQNLTEDQDLVMNSLLNSDIVEVDVEGKKFRPFPQHHKCIMVRDTPGDLEKTEILKLFSENEAQVNEKDNGSITKPIEVSQDEEEQQNVWILRFETEQNATDALSFLQTQKLRDANIVVDMQQPVTPNQYLMCSNYERNENSYMRSMSNQYNYSVGGVGGGNYIYNMNGANSELNMSVPPLNNPTSNPEIYFNAAMLNSAYYQNPNMMYQMNSNALYYNDYHFQQQQQQGYRGNKHYNNKSGDNRRKSGTFSSGDSKSNRGGIGTGIGNQYHKQQQQNVGGGGGGSSSKAKLQQKTSQSSSQVVSSESSRVSSGSATPSREAFTSTNNANTSSPSSYPSASTSTSTSDAQKEKKITDFTSAPVFVPSNVNGNQQQQQHNGSSSNNLRRKSKQRHNHSNNNVDGSNSNSSNNNSNMKTKNNKNASNNKSKAYQKQQQKQPTPQQAPPPDTNSFNFPVLPGMKSVTVSGAANGSNLTNSVYSKPLAEIVREGQSQAKKAAEKDKNVGGSSSNNNNNSSNNMYGGVGNGENGVGGASNNNTSKKKKKKKKKNKSKNSTTNDELDSNKMPPPNNVVPVPREKPVIVPPSWGEKSFAQMLIESKNAKAAAAASTSSTTTKSNSSNISLSTASPTPSTGSTVGSNADSSSNNNA